MVFFILSILIIFNRNVKNYNSCLITYVRHAILCLLEILVRKKVYCVILNINWSWENFSIFLIMIVNRLTLIRIILTSYEVNLGVKFDR